MLSGQSLGKYEILAEIGHGTFGRVYQAKDGIEGGIVALKVLPASPELREQHIKEAKVMRQLDHPNIVHIYNADFIVDGPENNFVIAMEYLPKGLDTLLQEAHRLPTEGAVGIASQVLEALCYAHAKGIIHHDIKPANIRLTKRDYSVKIVDFGLSEELGTYSYAKGFSTFAYMAPECYGEENRYDYQSELWAVGVLLFKMLTGKLPFNAPHRGDPYSWEAEVKKKSPPPLKAYLDDVQPRLQEVLDRALAKDACTRYLTSQDFLQSLQALQVGNKASTGPSDEREQRTGPRTPQAARPIAPEAALQKIYAFLDKALEDVQVGGTSFRRYFYEQSEYAKKGCVMGFEAAHSAVSRCWESIRRFFGSDLIGLTFEVGWPTFLFLFLVLLTVVTGMYMLNSLAPNHAGPSSHHIGATQKSATIKKRVVAHKSLRANTRFAPYKRFP